MQARIMRFVCLLMVILGLGGWGFAPAHAAAVTNEYRLMDGTRITGDVSAFDDFGVVFRVRTGGFSDRISWSKFTQETLKLLAENPKMKPLAEPFIELPPDSKPKPKPVVVMDPVRVERPTERTSFFSSFTTPVGLFVLALLYAANLFAAFEIASYRNRPVALVCGLSALLPVLGPLIFLVSPTLGEVTPPEAAMATDGGAAPALPPPPTGPVPHKVTGGLGRVGVPPPVTGAGLRVAAQAKGAGSGSVEPRVFDRNQHKFDRRFIETTFSGFFRVVPTEAEKDLVLVVRTPKQEYLAKRITRISSNEMFLQLLQGGAKEVSVSFGEIAQVIIRHKDDNG